ncbi:hypothetical protein [Lacticaseibacillus nasuensis]|uniref:hypothetical protein n=1 Tax=Lacticaseibacillus nasuensis TaxID=944671 RepID=UPI0022466EA0|nr:hypothetical protein [Lacticaseibacillus nasuensis]MCX2455393.1 hypothetical protein [Lacticaseibacillus nasuensis]
MRLPGSALITAIGILAVVIIVSMAQLMQLAQWQAEYRSEIRWQQQEVVRTYRDWLAMQAK